MRALVAGIGHRFVELGGDWRTATLVDRVEAVDSRSRDRDRERPEFVVVTRRRDRLRARQVAFNLPLDLAARLLDRPLSGRMAGAERKSRAFWSAFTGYLAIDRGAVPDDTHCSTRSCSRMPGRSTTAIMSWCRCRRSRTRATAHRPFGSRPCPPTLVRPIGLVSTPRPIARRRRNFESASSPRWLGRCRRPPPRWCTRSSPRPELPTLYSPHGRGRWRRPVSRSNSNFLAVGPDVLGPGLWVVGDSVFPGRGPWPPCCRRSASSSGSPGLPGPCSSELERDCVTDRPGSSTRRPGVFSGDCESAREAPECGCRCSMTPRRAWLCRCS